MIQYMTKITGLGLKLRVYIGTLIMVIKAVLMEKSVPYVLWNYD